MNQKNSEAVFPIPHYDVFSQESRFSRIAGVKSVLQYGGDADCETPCVSVIMPVYNRGDKFRESLLSVVNQDYKFPYEIVVVDNYDKDNNSPNLEIVKEVGAKNIMYYRHEANLGYNGNCNRGIELARAPYITFCHDDDLFLPFALSRLMELQEKCGDKCIISVYKTIDADGNILNDTCYPNFKNGPFLIQKDYFRYTLWDQFLASGGLLIGSLFNRNKLIAIGGFDEDYEPVTDYALQVSYTHYYGCIMNNIPIFKYRIGENASMLLYTQFANAHSRIQKIIARKLLVPNFILNIIIKAHHNYVRIISEITFGDGDESMINELKWNERLILKTYLLYRKLREYRIYGHVRRYKKFKKERLLEHEK